MQDVCDHVDGCLLVLAGGLGVVVVHGPAPGLEDVASSPDLLGLTGSASPVVGRRGRGSNPLAGGAQSVVHGGGVHRFSL